MFMATTDKSYFATLVSRMRNAGCTPIALYGAGRVASALKPAEAGAEVVAVIDDDPSRQGGEFAGLPVVSAARALDLGVKAVIITAEPPVQDKLWARRRMFLDAGIRVLCVPKRFDEKSWDTCLAEHYDYTIGVKKGLEPMYGHEYPSRDCTESAWLLDPLVRRVKPGMSICEIGAGNGRWTAHVIGGAGAYYAVDYSERLLYEVIEHRFAEHIDKLRLVHDETASLKGVPDASVDLLFSFDVFVHFKADLVHQFLAAAKRVLKPGGRALLHFATWNDSAIKVWQAHHKDSHGGGTSMIFYNHPDGLSASARSLGLKAAQVCEPAGQNVLVEFTHA